MIADKLAKTGAIASPALILWVLLQLSQVEARLTEKIHAQNARIVVLETRLALTK